MMELSDDVMQIALGLSYGESPKIVCHQCGACCTEISISSPIPGLPDGKPAGVMCPHLSLDNKCYLFGKPSRPSVCSSFQADEDFCGSNQQEAIQQIRWYENKTKPH